jgi:curved DNA-binding protein CbpA
VTNRDTSWGAAVSDSAKAEASVRDAYEVLEVRPDASQVVVQAAFRALAAINHPDAPGGSTRRMAELNIAYAQVRTPDLRSVYDRLRRSARPTQADTVVTPPRRAPAKGVLDFGRYEGWSITDLARHDPDYLTWLSRHSSGIRYRGAIEEAMRGVGGAPTASQRTRGR